MKKLLPILLVLLSSALHAQVHTTYLWHLQQPIYWPENSQWAPAKYQAAHESHYLKVNGGNIYPDGQAHPLNDLEEIFGKDDRKAVYQWRAKDAVQTLLGLPDAGAQVNYSGCLIENVNSLANAGQWGYSPGWQNNFITARNWQTSGGNPRMDILGFTFHHALAPLISENVLRKEIQAHRHIYQQTFGTSPDYSKGFWPAECSFSTRIIKVLAEEGFEWSVIANSHLARTLADYPLSFGTSGCNIDPPNAADKVTTIGSNWWSGQIDGRGGTFAAPYCYQAHKAQYIDPETGEVFKITVVPMDDVLSYMNGYALMGTGEIDAHIAPFDDPAHPGIVLLAHDGDNAWGGGYDYYHNSVPQFAQAAANQGYIPTTVQQFLDNNPVPEDHVVHVEDGSWVNAANDWGHPQFINWLWPMYTQNFEFDPNGWTEDARNWAVLTAAENHVQMAEDIAGTPPIAEVVSPNEGSSAVARAWHHLLPGYTSGYMYYGTALDMEVKQTLAANIAVDHAAEVINANPGVDNTPPNVFIPQRYPYNPGATGFGPTYGYQQHQNSSDFTVWTFAYDVNGLENVVLKYRLDDDGANPLDSHENDTYAGGAGVGDWIDLPMQSRLFPAGNVNNNPDIDFFIMPDYIAYQYWAEISGLSEVLVDYYVEATDVNGNTFKTPIQHVYVGAESPGGQGNVSWTPEEPDNDDLITIVVENATQGGNLHWGINGFNQPIEDYWPEGTFLVGGTGPAVETPFEGPNAQGQLVLQIGPFNNPAQEVSNISFVIHYDDDTWENNNGQDYVINLGPGGTDIVQWLPSEPNEAEVITITVNDAPTTGMLHWGVNGWNNPDPVYWPEGSVLFGGTGPAVQSPMVGPNPEGQLTIQIGPFNQPEQEVTVVDFVIAFDDGTWNNNNGQDYHITIGPAPESGSLAGAVSHGSTGEFLAEALITVSDGVHVYSGESGNGIAPDINYQIENIIPGTYSVVCTADGFETMQLNGVEILVNETAVADFSMIPVDYPLPSGWEFAFTPTSHVISIPETVAPQFNGLPLQNGDYIGVFYLDEDLNEACGGAIQWQLEGSVISAFGDDSFTVEKDGFAGGEPLIWKIYRQQQQQSFYALVSYDPALPDTEGTFVPFGVSQLLSLEAFSTTLQTLNVPAGWSGVSLFVDPVISELETIFAPFPGNPVIMASQTGIYYPAEEINTIGNWDYEDGYQIKANESFTLEVEGFDQIGTGVTLDSGWNLIPVLTDCGAGTEELFGAMNSVNIVKEVAGTAVYWPAYGISTLTTLNPGRAYWISVNEDDSFTYPECTEVVGDMGSRSEQNISSPWNEVHTTAATHLFALPGDVLQQAEINAGDLIGVFGTDDKCYGVFEVGQTGSSQAMVAFADDETTSAKEGLTGNEPVSFRLYRPSSGKEGLLEADYDADMPQQGNFKGNGVSAISGLTLTSYGISEAQALSFEIYPNPAQSEILILFDEKAGVKRLEILNLQGKMIHSYDVAAGKAEMNLDIRDLEAGIYIVKATGFGSDGYEKLIVF
ncbi:MAG: T9SS type A sorting domain-containing protein [Bacteroidales bacterium]